MKKGFAPILIILLIFVIGGLVGVGYLAWMRSNESGQSQNNEYLPTKEETSEWKTYSDDTFDFSVSYPPDWKLSSNSPVGSSWNSATLIDLFSPGTVLREGEPAIEMGVNVSVMKASLYSIDKEIDSLPELGGEVSAKEPIIIGSMSGTSVELINSVGGIDRKLVYVQKGDLIYNLTLMWRSGKPELKEIPEQILSTFVFNDTKELVEYLEPYYKDQLKSGSPTYELQILVTKINGNFAMGVSDFTNTGGDVWFAVKSDGKWRVIEQTQEPPTCSIMSKYNFPKSLYVECINK